MIQLLSLNHVMQTCLWSRWWKKGRKKRLNTITKYNYRHYYNSLWMVFENCLWFPFVPSFLRQNSWPRIDTDMRYRNVGHWSDQFIAITVWFEYRYYIPILATVRLPLWQRRFFIFLDWKWQSGLGITNYQIVNNILFK